MNRFTIGRKLTLGVSALALFLLVLSYTSLRAISTLGGSLDRAMNGTAKKLQLIGEAQQSFQDLKTESLREQIAYAILDLERSGDGKGQPQPAAAGSCSACHSPAAVGESIHQLEANGAAVRQKVEELRRLVSDEAGRKALGVIDAGVSGWLDSSKEYLALADNKRFEQAHALLRDKMFPLLEGVAKATGLVSQQEREALAASDQEARSEIAWSRWAATILIGLNLLVAGVVIWLVHETMRTLRRAMTEMNTGMAQVATAAGEVSAASQALAQGASEQAAALAETSSSSEEIDSMARKNSENSRAAAELVTQSQQRFVETSQALNEMVLAMGEINTQSDKISKIIRVIDEIAFQTNILALNAAVEAARAGEAGLGFAVVADEVRSLAQRCAQAAKDTAELIEESINKSNDGKGKVDHVAAQIRIITDEAGTVKTLVDEVDLGSQEQSRGIEQIGRAIVQMNHVTTQNASTAEENAAAAQELTAQSGALREVVRRLVAIVGGETDPTADLRDA